MARRKEPGKAGAVLRVAKHPYLGDGVPDHTGEDRCQLDGLRRSHPVHQLEPVDEDTAELERRIAGGS